MALISIPGRDTTSAMSSFVDGYGLGEMPHLPDMDGRGLWTTYGVSYQPRWLLIRADESEERGGGAIPDSIVADALTPG